MLHRLGLTLFLCLFALASTASAEKRIALVVGNSAYENSAQLPNPVNDAQAVAGMFKAAGFDVVNARTNLGNLEFKRALRDFAFAANNADIAVVFFAGHGIEVKGTNYLLPVDAKLAADYDAEDEAVSLNRVIEATENAKRLRLIILDACRDNPFIKTMRRSVASRAVTSGLAKVEPAGTDTIIAYAAKAGSTAEDGAGTNSPFTAALLKHLSVPGRDIRIAFGHVRDEVLANTGRKQEPFVYGSLGGTAVELVPAPKPAPAPVVAAPPADQNAAIRRDYEFAERVGTKEAWDLFLSTYSTGFYANLAQAQRNKLVAEENRVAATEKAKAAEQARLAAEGSRAAEQAKAKAQAEAAEQARIAAERAKKAEEDKLAEMERAKPAVEATTPAPRDLAVTSKAEERPVVPGPAVAAKPVGPVAALTPPAAPEAAKPAPGQVPRLLLTELRRVGCHTGSIDDSWNANARRSLDRFNKRSGHHLDTTLASLEALDAVKNETSRVCPLQCGVKEVERNGSCVAKVCASGLTLDSDGDCVKPKGRAAAAPPPQKPLPPAEKKPAQTSTSEKKAGGAAGSCAAGFQSCMSKMISVGWKSWEAAQRCGC
jgi:uncharacterized caspase-like protein